MDFEEEINQILAVIPRERNTYLFSATMTSKVAKLQKASLTNPVKVEVSNKFQVPKQLVQQYLFIPAKWKDCYLAYALDEFKGQSAIIFVATCNNAIRVALLLRNLGFSAVCLHGQLSQPKRLGALNKFKAGQRNILVATDVASRGLDIPDVDLVLNFDIPRFVTFSYIYIYVEINILIVYSFASLLQVMERIMFIELVVQHELVNQEDQLLLSHNMMLKHTSD
jgi:ATP-dependent RNA helicase DDX47/RRP3